MTEPLMTLAGKIIRDVRAAIHDDLNAAWADAEAAAHAIAPGIGTVTVSRWAWNVPEPFVASWRMERAFAATPAAALLALAAALPTEPQPPIDADIRDIWRTLSGADIRAMLAMWQARQGAATEPADGLDAAWAAAEAALPEGWRFGSLRAAVAFDGYVTSVVGWTATAHEATGIGRSDPVEGSGPTPAAALLTLAARLRSEPVGPAPGEPRDG